MDKTKSKLAERLVFLRKQNNLSQYKLAEILGFSRGLIANYEQGRREPDYDTLLLFASFYCASVDFLLGMTEDKNTVYGVSVLDRELLHTINNLKPESKEELNKYVELLKMRDNTV